jgi:hypothetical protein
MGPCPFFAWIGISKKVFDLEDQLDQKKLTEFWTAQLLGTIDYDLDIDENSDAQNTKTEIFKKAIAQTVDMGIQGDGRMRAVAWTALLTMDQQTYNRQVMYKCKSNPETSVSFPCHLSHSTSWSLFSLSFYLRRTCNVQKPQTIGMRYANEFHQGWQKEKEPLSLDQRRSRHIATCAPVSQIARLSHHLHSRKTTSSIARECLLQW